MILEVIVTTTNADGTSHIAPMGIREQQDQVIIAPFKPSATMDNILRNGTATINRLTDVRIFAGCLTGRKDWQLLPTKEINGHRLACALSHSELQLDDFKDDELRPEFYFHKVLEEVHAPFNGFNRAQAAVLEAAILVSRLHMLPAEKIDQELKYLQIAIDKTAGENEKTAWSWLMEKVEQFRNETGVDVVS